MGAKFVSRSVLGIFFATAIFVKGIESTDKIEDFPDYYPDYPDNIDPKGKDTFHQICVVVLTISHFLLVYRQKFIFFHHPLFWSFLT